MLSLKNISKTYKSKKGVLCRALTDISLNFGEKGLTFLLGKSGCGKTTLLNILGGLDKADSGEMFYNGVCVQNEEKALNEYRNGYVGFVFQDYNLIDEFTVEQNIEVALSLQNGENKLQAVKAALETVGLDGSEKKYPSELSGGQKQRVAIARAIVKDSKIILADEPTGNLDSETGEAIFNLLKEISKDKLVIVVTHDKESTEKYGDRTVEMRDGKIVSDSLPIADGLLQNAAETHKKESNSRLKTSLALKMGFHNLGKRKIRFLITAVIAVLSVFITGLSQMFLAFMPEQGIVETCVKNQWRYVSYRVKSGDLTFDDEKICEETFAKYGVKTIPYLSAAYGNAEFTEGLSEAEANGFEFYSARELSENGAYFSDYRLKSYIGNEYYYEENGENIAFTGDTPYEDLVDKTLFKIGASGKNYAETPVIDGVYKHPFLYFCDFGNGKPETYDEMQPPYTDEELYFYHQQFVNELICPDILYRKGDYSVITSWVYGDAEYERELHIEEAGITLELTEEEYSSARVYGRDNVSNVLTAEGMSYIYSMQKGEVVIAQDIYNKLFPDNQLTWASFNPENAYEWERNPPLHLGEKIKLAAYDLNGKSCETDELAIVGVVQSGAYDCYTAQSNFTPFAEYLFNFKDGSAGGYIDLGANDTKSVISALLSLGKIYKTDSSDSVNMHLESPFSRTIYDNKDSIMVAGYVLLFVSIAASVIMVLSMAGLLAQNYTAQKKEIGILRSLGAKKSDIMKIFLFQAILLCVIVLVVSMAGVYLMAMWQNVWTLRNFGFMDIVTVKPLWSTVFLICGISIIVPMLAALIPLIRISEMKPVDAIRGL